MRKSALNTMIREHIEHAGGNRTVGLDTFQDQVSELVEEKGLEIGSVRLRDLYEAMCIDGVDNIPDNHSAQEVSEAMTAAGFPAVTGTLIHPRILKAYETNLAGTEMMVTQVESNVAEDNHGGFGAMDNFELVEERMPYEEAQPNERKITIANKKFGRTLSVTLEMVMFDKTSEVLLVAQRIGSKAGSHQHRFVVEKSCDLATNATGEAANRSLRVQGTYRNMYAADHSSWDNGITNDNALTAALSDAALVSADTLIAALQDDKGDEMTINPKILLVHNAIALIAKRLMGSEKIVGSNFNELNVFKDAYTIIKTPFVDSVTSWYLGDFAEQMILQWVYRLRTEALRSLTADSFRYDIVAQFKAGYYLGVGASDYRFVVQGNV